jgi:chemotaxis response regulator CheB
MKSRAPKTIALLEEARQHREQVGSILREAGYEVFSTRSPEEIKEAILNSRRVGMIILQNLVLLGRSPIDFIKELRLLGFKDTICVMANQIDNNFTERALAAGCNEVMEKPIRAEDLLARCKHHLGLPIKRNYFFPDLILIGASTGGTEVLVKMLAQLPSHCPPLLVVQHISPNFAQDFAKRLAKSAGLTLGAIKNGEKLQSGHLYMALHDYHIRVLRQEGSLRLDLNLGPHRNNHRPSVDVLFESALSVRAKIVACLMTGMGSDGAIGLLKLRQQGALTMAQDEASSVVFGMPKEAIRIDAVDFVCNPDHMRQLLNDILKTTSASRPLSASSA